MITINHGILMIITPLVGSKWHHHQHYIIASICMLSVHSSLLITLCLCLSGDLPSLATAICHLLPNQQAGNDTFPYKTPPTAEFA